MSREEGFIYLFVYLLAGLSIIIAISLIYIHDCPPKLMSRRSLAIFIQSSDFRRDATLVENKLLFLHIVVKNAKYLL